MLPPRTPDATWQRALAALRASDDRMAALLDHLEVRPLARREPARAFETLARSIVSQQLSNRAAATIWGRVCTHLDGEVSPAAWTRVDPAVWRACGLSGAKVRYVTGLAERMSDGGLDPHAWRNLDDESVLGALTKVPGIGRWTASMYLIFHEARLDVLAVEDAALRRAGARMLGRERSMTGPELAAVAEVWRPWRSVASVYLWKSLG
jgi:DNA-3-methyladenine glycosylase II